MRRLSVCALTAVAALAVGGAVPMAASAATNTYSMQGGNGKVIMIGGNNMGDLQQILGQINGGANFDNCTPNYPMLPPFDYPGNNMPDSNIPDISLPLPGFPSPDQPWNPGTPNPDQPGNPGNPNPDLPEDSGNGTNQDAFASQVVKLVNEERAKAGLSSLTVHAGAANAAQTRAKEIETSFSHTRPNGSSFSSALREAGVNYSGAGENIAYGQTSPQEVMEGWMNSAGHRANILNASFTSIGVSHYKSAAGVDYWTQLFIN